MAFSNTQAKGSFKIMEDDVADTLEADFILPESAVKQGLKVPAVMYSIFGPGRRFRGLTWKASAILSRQLEFESSYTFKIAINMHPRTQFSWKFYHRPWSRCAS